MELNESTVYTMQYVILARIEKLYTFSVSGQVLEELTRLLRSYFWRVRGTRLQVVKDT